MLAVAARHRHKKEAQPWAQRDVEYAEFVPLPPETNVPRPAEPGGQPWLPLDDNEAADDDVAVWNEYEDECGEDDDAMSDCHEYEPDSLESAATAAGASVTSSLDDDDDKLRLLFSRRGGEGPQAVPVYAGPALLLEELDSDDDGDSP